MSKKIFIIGNSAKVFSLSKKLSKDNDVYVAPGSDTIKEFATCVDIRPDSVTELLEFVMENGIDITIPVSEEVMATNIVDVFNANNQQIFAPSKSSVDSIFNKALSKKIMYKLRIPTPKFGIFEKQNMVFDYIKSLKTPFVLKTNDVLSAVVLTSVQTAKNLIESVFTEKGQKVIIEDYVWGTPFSFYTITDGYRALPIGSSITYKHSLEGDGGQLTSGMGACVPNYKLSIDNEYFLMENVVYPVLEYLESNNAPYLGILGVNGILNEDGSIQIIGFQSFMNDCDCSAILEMLDIDLLKLIEACLVGSFSDEFEYIPQKDLAATSVVLQNKNRENFQNVITGLDDTDAILDFYPSVTKNRYLELEANTGSTMVVTSVARTPASATAKVYEEVKNLDFKGVYYRKDICKIVNC